MAAVNEAVNCCVVPLEDVVLTELEAALTDEIFAVATIAADTISTTDRD